MFKFQYTILGFKSAKFCSSVWNYGAMENSSYHLQQHVRTLFMCFLTLSGYSHCVNQIYELLRDHQVIGLSFKRPKIKISIASSCMYVYVKSEKNLTHPVSKI